MIDFVQGILTETQPTRAVVECGGVGYEVFIPVTTHVLMPPAGHQVQLFTVLQVRQDAHLLYGFATRKDRHVFRLLTSVTGVGPRIALNVLSHIGPTELSAAVASGEVGSIQRIPGVGSKLVTRIVTELRDAMTSGRTGAAVEPGGPAIAGTLHDAEKALIALGYKPDHARRAVAAAARANPSARLDVAALIQAAISGSP